MTTTTRTRKSRAKVAPVETPMVSLAGVGVLVPAPEQAIAEFEAAAEVRAAEPFTYVDEATNEDIPAEQVNDVMDVPLSAGDTVDIFDGLTPVEAANQDLSKVEVKTFTISGSHIVDGTKVEIVVEAVAPVAFVKVGAKRVGKAHLVVTESDSGAMALTYVNRRGESRIVTEAQFIAIYKSGITTPIDVPVKAVVQTPEVVQQEVSELLELLAPVTADPISDLIAEGADNIIAYTESQNDFGPTEADMALLAEEIEMAEIDGPGAETVTFEH